MASCRLRLKLLVVLPDLLHPWLPAGDPGGLRQTIGVGKSLVAACTMRPPLIHCRELRSANLVWTKCQGQRRLAQARRPEKALEGPWC
jgi:hypothetical protein